MKTRIILLVIILTMILSYYFILQPSGTLSYYSNGNTFSDIDTGYIIGAIESGKDINLSHTGEINLNSWHLYCPWMTSDNRWIPGGWIEAGASSDTLFADSTVYINQVNSIIMRNRDSNMVTYLTRPKITYLMSAQRSDYQCEYIESNVEDREWWYAFDAHGNYNTNCTDSGKTVLYCNKEEHSAGYAVKDLRTKNEQVSVLPNPSAWDIDSNYAWYIKPRIRIRPEDAYDNKLVCRVEVFNFDGDTVIYQDIKGYNFIDYVYNGQYSEKYYSYSQDTINLIVSKRIFNPDGKIDTTGAMNKMDIRIYWYGECDMWIDYVRVDNEIAELLYNNLRDDWIRWESAQIAGTAGSYYFWVDEPSYNMLGAVKYVKDKIKQYNPNTSITFTSYSAFLNQ